MKTLEMVKSKWELPASTNEELLAMLPKACRTGKTVIIDPVSPEFNRGSFCYLGYLLYAAMDDLGLPVEIKEDFCAAGVDDLPQVDMYLICLWSHTQIEHVHTLTRFLPRNKVLVFGFDAMVQGQYLPHYTVPAAIIQRGISRYHRSYGTFKQILLSDCDMHLKGYSGQVYPYFTTYGCPRGCSFCPTTLNLPPDHQTGGRIATPLPELIQALKEMMEGELQIRSWHFTDEDFFLDHKRTHAVIEWLIQYQEEHEGVNLQIITLGERHTVKLYAKKYGWEPLMKAGIKLIEIGLESAEEDLGKDMGKGGVKACHALAKDCPIPILWLTMAFYPGDSINALRKTGDFMKENGLSLDQLYDRITTNGTYGGLGQFWQYYEGYCGEGGGYSESFAGHYDSIDRVDLDGLRFTTRPMRLLPSFVPRSFIEDKITDVLREIVPEDLVWFDNYQIDPPVLGPEVIGLTVKDAMELQYDSPRDGYLAFAVAAKIGALQGTA